PTSRCPIATSTPRSSNPAPSDSARTSARSCSASWGRAWPTWAARSTRKTTGSSPGGPPGATCASATSAGASTMSWPARRSLEGRASARFAPTSVRATTPRWSRRFPDAPGRRDRLLAPRPHDLVVGHAGLDLDQELGVAGHHHGLLVVGPRELLHGLDRLPVRHHDEVGLGAVRSPQDLDAVVAFGRQDLLHARGLKVLLVVVGLCRQGAAVPDPRDHALRLGLGVGAGAGRGLREQCAPSHPAATLGARPGGHE